MAGASNVGAHPLIPERVLIVRTGAIGDVTNALVLAEALKATGQVSQLGWVVHPLSVPLLQGHPAVDQVHVLQRDGGLAEWLRLRRELRAEQYELAIDAQRILKSAVISRMSGAPRSIGFDRGRSKEGSWLFHSSRITPMGGTHMVDWYMEFAEALGLEQLEPRHRLPLDTDAEAWASGVIAHLSPDAAAGPAPLCIHIGGTKAAKRWEPQRYGELILQLQERSLGPIILTGGPGDRADAEVALQVSQPALDLVGKTSLPRLISILRRCRAWVGCDTGPMHLAAALDCPVVALFAVGQPDRTGPYGTGHHILGKQIGGDNLPMGQITVSEVSKAVEQSLRMRTSRSGEPPFSPPT
ncbi:MAG: glycosyltransferase family 9 protein [Planctomycetota bacterium]|nr:glycosyltransferase family 9 protein [Planctomycetota bacterium]